MTYVSQTTLPSEFLKDQPVFRDVSKIEMTKLSLGCVTRKLVLGEVLYSAADTASFVWFVRDGLVHTSIQSRRGKDLTSEVFKPGDLFGSRVCQEEGHYYFDASGLVASVVVGVPNRAFDAFLDRSTRACAVMLKDGADRMRQLILLRAALNERADQKVGAVLLWMHQRLGKNIPMTRGMIATLAGLSNETVSRVMSPWAKKGWLSSRRGLIIIEHAGNLKASLT